MFKTPVRLAVGEVVIGWVRLRRFQITYKKPLGYFCRASLGFAFLVGRARIFLNTYIYSYRSQHDRTQALPVLAVVHGI